MKAIALVMMFGICCWISTHTDLFDPIEPRLKKFADVVRAIVALSLAISFILFWIDVLFFPALAR